MATARAVPIANGNIPAEGSRGLPVVFDFTAGTNVNISLNIETMGLSEVQTLFIDNSNSPSATVLTVVGTNQALTVPPYAQAFFPVLFVGPNLQINGYSTGNVKVNTFALNIPLDLAIWYVTAPGSVTGTVAVTGTVTTVATKGAFTNRSGSIAVAGTSQQLAAANGARNFLIIENPSDTTGQNVANIESLFINFTAVAAVDDGNSIEIMPGGSLIIGPGFVTTELVNVSAATIGHRYIAREA